MKDVKLRLLYGNTWNHLNMYKKKNKNKTHSCLKMLSPKVCLRIIHFIIIIMSRHQHGYPWPFLATLLYREFLPAGLQGYIPYQHRVAVSRFLLVILAWLIHVKGSTGIHHLWVWLTSPAVSRMSDLSNLDSFRDGW